METRHRGAHALPVLRQAAAGGLARRMRPPPPLLLPILPRVHACQPEQTSTPSGVPLGGGSWRSGLQGGAPNTQAGAPLVPTNPRSPHRRGVLCRRRHHLPQHPRPHPRRRRMHQQQRQERRHDRRDHVQRRSWHKPLPALRLDGAAAEDSHKLGHRGCGRADRGRGQIGRRRGRDGHVRKGPRARGCRTPCLQHQSPVGGPQPKRHERVAGQSHNEGKRSKRCQMVRIGMR